VIVIYPDETWYTFVDKKDIDEIIEEHLVKGKIVKRLLVDSQV
jgi:(2Fe-2S) ferredoxin